jgi:hypothetical protein
VNSIKRIGQLLFIQLKKDWGFLLVFWGILATPRLIEVIPLVNFDVYLEVFVNLSLFFYMGRIFSELSDSKESAMSYLSLPADPWEKFISKYLFSSLGVLGGSLGAFLIADVLSASLGFLIFRDFSLSGVTADLLWTTVQNFFLGHAVLFTGSLFFKKSSNFKTAGLVAVTLVVSMVVFFLSLVAIVGAEEIVRLGEVLPESMEDDFDFVRFLEFSKSMNIAALLNSPWISVMDFLVESSKVIANWLLTPYLLLLSYWKFTEKEVR